MKKTIIALGLVAITAGGVALAAPVNVRQVNQERRIDAGVRSGKLTHAEEAQLNAQQAAIRREEARMRARHGGKLTAHDKAIIHAKQQQADRSILKQKYDAQHGKKHLKIG